MSSELLNDAAIVLHRILSNENIKYGIFGGYAISAFGGHRLTKDIDVLVSGSKDEIVKLITGEHGFEAIEPTRDDYVAFFWTDKASLKFPVLVKIFYEQFPGHEHTMEHVTCTTIPIKGLYHGPGIASFLDPPYLFKGKVHAAKTRYKAWDTADMRALVTRFEEDIADHIDEISMKDIGLAMKRHADLAFLFRQLDVDIDEAELAAKTIGLHDTKKPLGVGVIQTSLLV